MPSGGTEKYTSCDSDLAKRFETIEKGGFGRRERAPDTPCRKPDRGHFSVSIGTKLAGFDVCLGATASCRTLKTRCSSGEDRTKSS